MLFSTLVSYTTNIRPDAVIATMLRSIPQDARYTVVYSSTPLNGTIAEEAPLYEPEFESQLDAHIDLKRSIEARVPPKTVEMDQRPLFEKYQFLTPGLFIFPSQWYSVASGCIVSVGDWLTRM